jgi:hypothetical protein
LRPRTEVEHLWRDLQQSHDWIDRTGSHLRFVDAPGDRGTEIHVEVEARGVARIVPQAVQKLLGTEPVAKAKDELRRFKQRVETGVLAQSDAVPAGELLESKRGQRRAQPLKADELQKVGS